MHLENRNDEKHRITPTSIDSLPDDDLITILAKLPAQYLHDTGRLVCRRWNRLIRSPGLINTHLQSSPSGVLIRCRLKDEKWCVFSGMNGGRIETYKLRYKLTDMILSSCNGLILLYDHDSQGLFVANPITKQHFSIPLYQERRLYTWSTCLGYDAVSNKYKVVHVNSQKECAILTLGVDDSWRPLPTDHLSNSIRYPPLVTEGFVHWVSYRKCSLVTLNLETETISDIPLPESLRWSHRFSAGKCLSFISVSQPGLCCWEVWEMRPGLVAEWNKLSDMDLEDKVGTLEKLSLNEKCVIDPFGWIKYKEVFLFVLGRPCTFVAYNVCTREFQTFEQDSPFSIYHLVAHTNSLVCLDEIQV